MRSSLNTLVSAYGYNAAQQELNRLEDTHLYSVLLDASYDDLGFVGLKDKIKLHKIQELWLSKREFSEYLVAKEATLTFWDHLNDAA